MIKLGIVGGNSTAKLLAQSASSFNIQPVILTPNEAAPALGITPHSVVGDYRDEKVLNQFMDLCDVMTLATQNVPFETIEKLSANGTFYPSVEVIQPLHNRLTQKRFFQKHFDVPRFRKISVGSDVLDAAQEFGFPLILKPTTHHDASKIQLIQRAHDIEPALKAFSGLGELMIEGVVNFVRELAVVIVRSRSGAIRAYPVTEIVTQHQVLSVVRVPGAIDEATAVRALEMARQAVEVIDGVGAFGVEMFEVEDNDVVFSEITPFPDKTAPYTIEGTITSQYENHIRALLDYPLGDVFQVAPATAMMTMIAEQSGEANPHALRDAFSTEGVHFHLYGYDEIQANRIHGHATVLGYNVDGAEKVARLALSRVKLGITDE